MATKNKAKAPKSGVDEHHVKTRLLLALWDMGGANAEVKKGKLTERVKRTGETKEQYQSLFEQLEKVGAIAIKPQKRIVNVSLTDKGLQELGKGLSNSDFEFDSQIGAKTANAVLRWFREQGISGNGKVVSANGAKAEKSAIASYDQFKPVALDVYDRLNRDYNFDDLVPIYRMRREIGDRVSRSQFSEWMLEMQANDIFELMGGEVLDLTPDQAEDSITPPVGKVRYFAKRVNSKA